MKLPASKLQELRRLCKGGLVPEWPAPESNEVYDIEAEIRHAIETELEKRSVAKLSPARRAFYGISLPNEVVKCDGFATGVALNDPGLLAAALEGASTMKLKALKKVLKKAEGELPPQETWRSIRKREAWFSSPQGESAAAALNALDEEFDDAEGDGYVNACILFALANPDEFFQAR